MTDYGLKISKSGYDVKSSSVGNSIFGSEWNTFLFETSKAQQIDITTNGSGAGSHQASHNYSYKPAFLLFSRLASTDNVEGVSYSNALFHASSGFFHPFYQGGNGWNHGIFCSSDTSNVNINISSANNKLHELYLYTFIDLAEETTYEPTPAGNDYGLRISQPGYDVKTDPDYRMSYSSKFKCFHIAKTGTVTVSAPSVTLSSGSKDLRKTEVTFSSLGIDTGYHPYLFMIENKSLSTGSAIGSHLDYLPFSIGYFVSSVDSFIATANMFVTDDRIVAYIWRSWEAFFGDPASVTFPAVSITFRYMIFKETMSF